MNATREEWRPVIGWEGRYQVSSRGEIRSVDRIVTDYTGATRTFKGRKLKAYAKDSGHLQVTLPDRRKYKVHHLVLEAFVGPRPDGLVGCHNDGDATNNNASNLRWDTQVENMRDMIKHGAHANTHKTHCPRGHILAEPNIRKNKWSRDGHRPVRSCLACNRASAWVSKDPANRKTKFALVADERYADIMNDRDKTGVVTQ